MAVKFLSTEWAEALKSELNASDAFREAADRPCTPTIQQVITGDEASTHYWIRIVDQTIDMGVGDAEAPDATITQSYDDRGGSRQVRGSPVTAFMTGKIKVSGNMGLLLGLQGVLTQLPEAMKAIDVEY